MRELRTLLRDGAHIVQAFQPRWPGDRPREVFYLQHGEQKRPIRQTVVIKAMRSRLLITAPGPVDGVSDRVWHLPSRKSR
jgi:hypothetical protein